MTREQVIEIAKLVNEIPSGVGAIFLDSKEVFISDNNVFFDIFKSFTKEQGVEEFPFGYYAMVDGVKFSCLSKTEAPF